LVQERSNHGLNKKLMECTCAPCKQFHLSTLAKGGNRIAYTSEQRADDTAILSGDKGPIKKGDRVVVQEKYIGKVQFVGIADDEKIAPKMHVGVQVYDNVYSNHNGTYKGKRFFFTPRGHAMMVPYTDVQQLHPIPQKSDLTGNPMFPSYETVKQRRKDRQKKILASEAKLIQEYELKRKAQIERYAKSVPNPRISPRGNRTTKLRQSGGLDGPIVIQDEGDIAYKDYLLKQKQRAEREFKASLIDQDALRLQKMRKLFGTDEKADRLGDTLNKLYLGLEEGRIIAMQDRDF